MTIKNIRFVVTPVTITSLLIALSIALPVKLVETVEYKIVNGAVNPEPVERVSATEPVAEKKADRDIKGLSKLAPGKGNYIWQSKSQLLTEIEFNREYVVSKELHPVPSAAKKLSITGETLVTLSSGAELLQTGNTRQPPFLLMLH